MANPSNFVLILIVRSTEVGLCSPENTLVSVQRSFALGCCGVEFDIQLLKDGTIILLHDDTLERTAHYEWENSELSFSEFQRIVTTSVHDLTYGDVPLHLG